MLRPSHSKQVGVDSRGFFAVIFHHANHSASVHFLARHARRVSKDSRPTLQRRCGRRPSMAEPVLKQFVRARLSRPDGDRRQAAQSGDAECNPATLWLKLNQKVVTKFVHADEINCRMGKPATLHPLDYRFESAKRSDLLRQGWRGSTKNINVIGVLPVHTTLTRFHDAPVRVRWPRTTP